MQSTNSVVLHQGNAAAGAARSASGTAKDEDRASVRDRETGSFLDRTKLHALNHKGAYFSVVGPLNVQRSPQGEPVIQAGDSEQGRDLGATVAGAIFTQAKSITATAVPRQLSLHETVDVVRDQFTIPFVGSAETVATEITRWFGRAFDGINVHAGHARQFRRFTQDVVPLLQQRGLFRSDYEHATLCGNLGLLPFTYHTR